MWVDFFVHKNCEKQPNHAQFSSHLKTELKGGKREGRKPKSKKEKAWGVAGFLVEASKELEKFLRPIFLARPVVRSQEKSKKKKIEPKGDLGFWVLDFHLEHQPRAQRILRTILAKRSVIGRKKKGRTKPSSWPGFGACVAGFWEQFGDRILGQGRLEILGTNWPKRPAVGEGKGEERPSQILDLKWGINPLNP